MDEASRRRLKTDRIDLFCEHRVDPNVPTEDARALRPLASAMRRVLGKRPVVVPRVLKL